MKKILSLILSALLVCSLFTSCEDGGEDRSCTVNVKIFNNADVSLVINKIEEAEHYDDKIYGTMSTQTTIPANTDKDFKIECKTHFVDGVFPSVDATIFDCYYTFYSTINYPYLGTIVERVVTRDSKKTNGGKVSHTSQSLASSNPEINVILNFVKTTDGDYVLAVVK